MTAAVRLARAADEPGLLALARACPMPGAVTIRTEREPRFLALNELQGAPWNVAVADEGGRIVASASSAVRDVYIDGHPTRCAYLGDLRIAPEARGGTLLWRIHRFVADILRANDVDLAHGSIVEGNVAGATLREERRGVPRYRPLGRIRVCAISGVRRSAAGGSIAIRRARPDDLPEVARALDAFCARHDFAPVWTPDRLAAAIAATPGLAIDRFLLAFDGATLAGVLAAWDQDALQRRRVLRYGGRVALYRALHDLRARARGGPLLPAPGEVIRELHVTHVGVADDRPEVFAALLRAAWTGAARSYHCMTFGLAEGHPLLGALAAFEHGAFHTVLHAVSWSDGRWAGHPFRGRLFHEISHL